MVSAQNDSVAIGAWCVALRWPKTPPLCQAVAPLLKLDEDSDRIYAQGISYFQFFAQSVLKQKNAPRRWEAFLQVVPPGIVIYTQVALYLHFEELLTPQSPPIAPPQNCPILRFTEADDFLLAKILILDEKSKGLGWYIDENHQNPQNALVKLAKSSFC